MKEVDKKSFAFWHEDHPYALHKSIFISQKCLSIYRFIMIIFFLQRIIYSLYSLSWAYFLYLTNWGFSLCFLFFFITAIEKHIVKNSHSFTWKLAHIIFETAITVEFSIMIFYWTALFHLDYDKHKNDSDLFFWFFKQFSVHFFSFLLLWIDNICNHIEIFWNHFIFIVIFQSCYLVLNCIYTLNVKNIYPPIKWVDAMSYVFMLIVFVLLIAHHYFAILFFRRVKKKRIEQEKEGNKALLEILT